ITPELADDWTVSSGKATTTKDGASAATAGFGCTAGSCRTVLVEKTAQVATVAVHNPYATVVAAPFNDLNNDGVKQDKEGRLGGWTVTAISTSGERHVLDTGNGGRAMFYPMTPGSYTLEMISPEPSSDPNVLDWTATNRAGCVDYGTGQKRCQVKVDVIAGEAATGGFGFVQLGTVGVTTYHDYDKDGVRDDNEPAQANRTVRLYDSTGKTLLQTKVTDVYGRVAFKAAAGVKYKVNAVLPTGWKQTAPVTSTGTPIASVPVVGPIGTQSTDLEFGQYNTVDSVAPPVPTSSAVAGTYDAVQNVTLKSETGATIRYTLSGAVPTATTGHVYTGPITLSNSHLLRAVAVDSAGNVSGEVLSGELVDGVPVPGLQMDVNLGTKAELTPTKWTVVTGGIATPATGMTVAGSLQQDDGMRVVLPSAYVTKSKSNVVDGYASIQLPLAQRNVVGLGVELDGRSTLTGSTRTLMLYDWAAGAWVTLFSRESQPITDLRSVSDASGNPARFVSGTGEVRLRMQALRTTGAFDMRLDQALLRIQHR
ncbi:MAG TPA: chitobiase/beta-hexosaminidase C-terminal domain-containing protein, partial [Microlunatus sp.]|nr:chitobiase/beta-hexosaminidase C-terminal domain-containing protein [Microlunatus sp.]